jgi:hypothetical protein
MHTDTMPSVGFKPMIKVIERAKRVNDSDRIATVIGIMPCSLLQVRIGTFILSRVLVILDAGLDW